MVHIRYIKEAELFREKNPGERTASFFGLGDGTTRVTLFWRSSYGICTNSEEKICEMFRIYK